MNGTEHTNVGCVFVKMIVRPVLSGHLLYPLHRHVYLWCTWMSLCPGVSETVHWRSHGEGAKGSHLLRPAHRDSLWWSTGQGRYSEIMDHDTAIIPPHTPCYATDNTYLINYFL